MSSIAIGLDLATANARAVAVEATTGQLLAHAQSPLPAPARAAGGHSRQPSAYGPVCLQLIKDVTVGLGTRSAAIAAICVTGTSGTITATDHAGAPLTAARLYDDRAGQPGLEPVVVRRAPMLVRARLLRAEAPAAALLMSSADIVLAALAGHPVPADTSHWLKAGLNLSTGDFDPGVLEALGMARECLPPLAIPGTVVGVVDALIGRQLGLPAQVRLVAGMTDGCTAQISSGAVHPGDTMGVLGTTLVLKAVCSTPVCSTDGAVYAHRAPDGQFWSGGASNVGGAVLASEFGSDELSALDGAAAEHGPARTVRYPLPRPGERFPIADPHLAPLRTNRSTSRIEDYRAALDGVALVERLGLERLGSLGVRPRRHVLSGGGSASAVWNSIRAAMITPALPADGAGVVLAQRSGSAMGAALLAIAGADGEQLSSVVDRLVPQPVPVRADPATHDVAEARWLTFRQLLADAGHHTPPTPSATTADSTAVPTNP